VSEQLTLKLSITSRFEQFSHPSAKSLGIPSKHELLWLKTTVAKRTNLSSYAISPPFYKEGIRELKKDAVPIFLDRKTDVGLDRYIFGAIGSVNSN